MGGAVYKSASPPCCVARTPDKGPCSAPHSGHSVNIITIYYPLCERVIRPQKRAKGLGCKLEGSLRKVMGGSLNVETVINVQVWGAGRGQVKGHRYRPSKQSHHQSWEVVKYKCFVPVLKEIFQVLKVFLMTFCLNSLRLVQEISTLSSSHLGKTCLLVLSLKEKKYFKSVICYYYSYCS